MENPHATSLPLLDEVKLQARVGRTSAFGALRPLVRVPAKVDNMTQLGQSGQLLPSRMAETLGVDKARPKLRC